MPFRLDQLNKGTTQTAWSHQTSSSRCDKTTLPWYANGACSELQYGNCSITPLLKVAAVCTTMSYVEEETLTQGVP
jgi:hypothetical protein